MNWDEEIPEENPEFVDCAPENLPEDECRRRIADQYRAAMDERSDAARWSRTHGAVTVQFMEGCEVYLHKELRSLRASHPVYQGSPEDLNQDLYVACLQLLDRPDPLLERSSCCLGTQIYNFLNWKIRAQARRMGDVLGIRTQGSDVLEKIVQAEADVSDQYAGERAERMEMQRLAQEIQEDWGPLAGMWLWGRYLGNSTQYMRRVLDISVVEADRLEDCVTRFLNGKNRGDKRWP